MKKKIIAQDSKDLSRYRREDVYDWVARGKTYPEISTLLKEKHNLDFTPTFLEEFCARDAARACINQRRDLYASQIKEVPIANKRNRLDDIQRMRNELFEMAALLDPKIATHRVEIIKIFRCVNEFLGSVREEMEGKVNQLQQLIHITELSHLSDEELDRKKEEIIAKALGNHKGRSPGLLENREGEEVSSLSESTQVPVASPEKL